MHNFKEITKRNEATNMLEILDPKNKNEYISINDYYERSSSTAHGGGENIVALTCFEHKPSPVLTNPECRKALEDTSLLKQSPDEVQKMSPVMIFNIIKSLGFQGELKDNKIRCQSYDPWLGNLTETDKITLESVRKNEIFINKLIGYLNANPSILNENLAS